jgi:hypothetical protein
MVRILKDEKFQDGKHYIEGACVHDDSKPTSGIVTGSIMLEVDTGDVFAFEEGDSPAWNKIAALGGSGS